MYGNVHRVYMWHISLILGPVALMPTSMQPCVIMKSKEMLSESHHSGQPTCRASLLCGKIGLTSQLGSRTVERLNSDKVRLWRNWMEGPRTTTQPVCSMRMGQYRSTPSRMPPGCDGQFKPIWHLFVLRCHFDGGVRCAAIY